MESSPGGNRAVSSSRFESTELVCSFEKWEHPLKKNKNNMG
jgi:hypothetical protein